MPNVDEYAAASRARRWTERLTFGSGGAAFTAFAGSDAGLESVFAREESTSGVVVRNSYFWQQQGDFQLRYDARIALQQVVTYRGNRFRVVGLSEIGRRKFLEVRIWREFRGPNPEA